MLHYATEAQIHGLINKVLHSPKLIVCQNGKVGTYDGICQSTVQALQSTTCNCNGAIYISPYIACIPSSTFLPMVNNLQNIKQVSVFNGDDGDYNAALDNNGVLYTWGTNNHGQLATGNTNSVVTPTPVLSNVKKIVQMKNSSSNFMMVIKNDNSLWGWGSDNNGYSGNGTPGGINPNPVQILTNVKNAVCSDGLCIALKYDGTLWAWGSGSINVFCNNPPTQLTFPPTKLDKFTTFIVDFDFNQYNFCYLIALDNNNNVFYAYNPNYSNHELKKLTLPNVANVYSLEGTGITYFLRTYSGDVYTFGNLSYYFGSITFSNDTIPKKILTLSNIIEIYPSNSKAYFLRQDGKLFFSGWPSNNEVYSCGNAVVFKNTCEVYLGCNLLVGVNESIKENNSIKIYPNPASNSFQLEINATDAIQEIFVSDISGRKIGLLEPPSGVNHTYDVSMLKNGIYFLNIKLKNKGTFTEKLILQN